MTLTVDRLQKNTDPKPTAFDLKVEFIPNDEFKTLNKAEVMSLPTGTSLYSDRDQTGLARVTRTGDFDALKTLPLLSLVGEPFLFRKMNYLKFLATRIRDDTDGSAASIAEFMKLVDDADAVRNHLAECNLRLIISIARKYSTIHGDFDELVSEGNMILLKAIDKFDFARGFRFSTYATHAVRRHFYRYCQKTTNRRKLESGGSCEFILHELPASDPEQIDQSSLEYEEQRLKRLIAKIYVCLDERERTIVQRRFGIPTGTTQTLREVAKHIGVSKERVRQIQNAALEKIRSFCGELNPNLSSM